MKIKILLIYSYKYIVKILKSKDVLIINFILLLINLI